jgi:hypothetical protein
MSQSNKDSLNQIRKEIGLDRNEYFINKISEIKDSPELNAVLNEVMKKVKGVRKEDILLWHRFPVDDFSLNRKTMSLYEKLVPSKGERYFLSTVFLILEEILFSGSEILSEKKTEDSGYSQSKENSYLADLRVFFIARFFRKTRKRRDSTRVEVEFYGYTLEYLKYLGMNTYHVNDISRAFLGFSKDDRSYSRYKKVCKDTFETELNKI